MSNYVFSRQGTRMRNLIALFVSIGVLYVGAYLGYRFTHTEVWDRDGRPYIIFGSKISYYAFRPASYLDGALTDTGFHIGPNQ